MFIFIILINSEVTTVVIQKDLYIRGEGTITQSIIRKNGDYKIIENIIIEDGPLIVDAAFTEMSYLQTITISKTIQAFQGSILFRNYMLKMFIVSPDNPNIWTDGSFLYQNQNKTLVGTINKPAHFNILPTVELLHDGCFRLKNFSIPPSVNEIQDKAFYKISSPYLHFEDIEKSNLTTIKSEAFCLSVITNIILPNGVTEIPDSCFKSSTLVSIKISANCAKISESAFAGCSKLSSVTVDPSNKAFKEVSGSLFSFDGRQLVFAPPQLEPFVIPEDLELISQSIVQSLVKVDRITIKPGNQNYSTFDGCLHSFDGKILLGVCGGVKLLNVSANTTSISDQACKGVGIISVRFLGEKCTSLGIEAFNGCEKLIEFIVPRGMKEIGDSCFMGSGLKVFAFERNSSLEKFNGQTFRSLNMKSIKLPKSLEIIGFASMQCTAETFEMEEGSALSMIGVYGLSISGLKERCSLKLPATLSSIDSQSFLDCELEISFEMGSILNNIPNEAFKNCKNIVGTFLIPSSVEKIGVSAFSYCVNIEKIVFEEGSNLTAIMGSAFKSCARLKELELPAFIESFDCSAISGCFDLVLFSVVDDNKNLSSDGNILYNKKKSELIVCSPGVENAYVDKNVRSIRSNGFYQCTKLALVEFNSPSNLETISQNTFAGCTNLAEVTFPTRVRELLENAFSGCEKLETVTFGSGSELSRIESGVFSGCVNLRTVLFKGSSLSEIGDSAFEGCAQLSSIEVPKSVQHFGKRCFMSSGIKSIQVVNAQSLEESAFKNCSNLESAIIESLAQIPESLFEGCIKLARFVVPQNAECLGPKCLMGTGLKSITIPSGVFVLDTNCFSNCLDLTEVNITSTNLSEIRKGSFDGCLSLKRIIYCGTKVITGQCGLDKVMCTVYVNVNYTGTEFCGLPPRKQLKEGCVFVDPTLKPSEVFTASFGELSYQQFMFAATLVGQQEVAA